MRSSSQTRRLNEKLKALQEEHKLLQLKYSKLERQYLAVRSIQERRKDKDEELREWRELRWAVVKWMMYVIQQNVSFSTIEDHLGSKLSSEDLLKLYDAAYDNRRHIRKRAVTLIFHLYGISIPMIMEFLFLSRNTVKRYIRWFEKEGVSRLLMGRNRTPRKETRTRYKEKVLSIIHSPPADYGINRTTWTIALIKNVLDERGYTIGKNTIPKIIKHAGYRFCKARQVLTSNDPEYRDKVTKITKILSSLGPKDRFFSIDEFGPFAVKKRTGRRYVRHDEHPTVPQLQRSKGTLIMTAALELSTNHITHFYSAKKDTDEMEKLLDILIEKYAGCRTIYLSGDAASWHSSKAFLRKLELVNEQDFRRTHNSPTVRLALLPAGAQFLNVIESVFSGMVKAVLDNSDYQSVGEAKRAIDLYLEERNEYFRKHPKKAGNKIWKHELVSTQFKEGQNCKNPR
jgi:transposase